MGFGRGLGLGFRQRGEMGKGFVRGEFRGEAWDRESMGGGSRVFS